MKIIYQDPVSNAAYRPAQKRRSGNKMDECRQGFNVTGQKIFYKAFH